MLNDNTEIKKEETHVTKGPHKWKSEKEKSYQADEGHVNTKKMLVQRK
jgi:hypothetical protein